MKLIKKTLIATALTATFIGSASAGIGNANHDVKLTTTVNKKVHIANTENISDWNFNFVSGSESVSRGNFCIYSNTVEGNFTIAATSGNGYKLVNSSNNDDTTNSIEYTLSLLNVSSGADAELVSSFADIPDYTGKGASRSSSCKSGAENNFALRATITAENADAAIEGAYQDTITLTASAV